MPAQYTTLEDAAAETGIPVKEIIALGTRGVLQIYELEAGTGARFVQLPELVRAVADAMHAVPAGELHRVAQVPHTDRNQSTSTKAADRLWAVINAEWPVDTEWLTLAQVASLAPFRVGRSGAMVAGPHGIERKPTYEYGMLSVLSTARRHYVEHEDAAVDEALSAELRRTNRNNGIWRRTEYKRARVRRLNPVARAGAATRAER